MNNKRKYVRVYKRHTLYAAGITDAKIAEWEGVAYQNDIVFRLTYEQAQELASILGTPSPIGINPVKSAPGVVAATPIPFVLPEPLPFQKWPAAAKTIAVYREEKHVGVGDTLAALFKKGWMSKAKAGKALLSLPAPPGFEVIASDILAFTTSVKTECNRCGMRQRFLNAKYPYFLAVEAPASEARPEGNS